MIRKIRNFVFNYAYYPARMIVRRGQLLLGHRRGLADRENRIYAWDFKGERLYASDSQINGLTNEYVRGRFERYYEAEYAGKSVLDVGGFVGDSALFFLRKGAAKVTVFEPLEANLAAARLNLSAFEGKVSLRKAFVCGCEGERTVKFSASDENCFGEEESGRRSCVVSCMPMEKALDGQYDVAKIDCEGCEYYLTGIDDGLIKRIPYWIIEFHPVNGRADRKAEIIMKFQRCGFVIGRTINFGKAYEIIHFRMDSAQVKPE